VQYHTQPFSTTVLSSITFPATDWHAQKWKEGTRVEAIPRVGVDCSSYTRSALHTDTDSTAVAALPALHTHGKVQDMANRVTRLRHARPAQIASE
jgi:hypothetical protein